MSHMYAAGATHNASGDTVIEYVLPYFFIFRKCIQTLYNVEANLAKIENKTESH